MSYIARMNDAILVFEVLRQGDINRGGTDTNSPPVPHAFFDADEKQWLFKGNAGAVALLVEHLLKKGSNFELSYQGGESIEGAPDGLLCINDDPV